MQKKSYNTVKKTPWQKHLLKWMSLETSTNAQKPKNTPGRTKNYWDLSGKKRDNDANSAHGKTQLPATKINKSKYRLVTLMRKSLTYSLGRSILKATKLYKDQVS